MILADKIMTLRKQNGWSQEELAEKLGVSRQSVSKWESAGSIPDLNKILLLSKLFGVSVDYLLKDEMEMVEYTEEEPELESLRKVTLDEAYHYLDAAEQNSRQTSLGVSLCILSPVALILFSFFSDSGTWGFSENLAAAFGVIILLLIIAVAVALFITNAMKMERYGYLEKELFDTEYGVDGMVGERKRQFAPVFARNLAVGIGLCILSVIPLVFAAALEASQLIIGICVCLLLAMISLGVNLIVRAAIRHESFEVLLQTGDYTSAKKERGKKENALETIYWCVVTAGYLAYSFITMDWHISWIVWPVAGVLYGAVSALAGMIASPK